ncbi:MAG: hypothetical protein Q3M24_11585 [Candidatus Electrothrix aestuarii]|uniref:Uncharacterized protein n=1 Tax=Candidatus Electrothrix aestuarii TaxID=3062594 RepID=A0AAU8M1M9_9BACT|nr:hypothetical protein [Candidatus Electrothrix aestuarii]
MNTQKVPDEVVADKRGFLRWAGAALGVVAAASWTGLAITKSAKKSEATNTRAHSVEEELRQQQIMTGKKMVVMTQEEKQKMLDRILRNHYRTVS